MLVDIKETSFVSDARALRGFADPAKVGSLRTTEMWLRDYISRFNRFSDVLIFDSTMQTENPFSVPYNSQEYLRKFVLDARDADRFNNFEELDKLLRQGHWISELSMPYFPGLNESVSYHGSPSVLNEEILTSISHPRSSETGGKVDHDNRNTTWKTYRNPFLSDNYNRDHYLRLCPSPANVNNPVATPNDRFHRQVLTSPVNFSDTVFLPNSPGEDFSLANRAFIWGMTGNDNRVVVEIDHPVRTDGFFHALPFYTNPGYMSFFSIKGNFNAVTININAPIDIDVQTHDKIDLLLSLVSIHGTNNTVVINLFSPVSFYRGAIGKSRRRAYCIIGRNQYGGEHENRVTVFNYKLENNAYAYNPSDGGVLYGAVRSSLHPSTTWLHYARNIGIKFDDALNKRSLYDKNASPNTYFHSQESKTPKDAVLLWRVDRWSGSRVWDNYETFIPKDFKVEARTNYSFDALSQAERYKRGIWNNDSK